jgi:hypothetical protein
MTSSFEIKSTAFFIRNKALLSCLFVWGTVNILQYAYRGIRTGGDTGRYTGAAINILNGEWPDGKAIEYMGYNVFVAFAQVLNSAHLFETIVAMQVLVSAVAMVCLYKIADTFGGTTVAVFASLAWVLFPDIQYWNFLILTESLFVSGVLISFYALVCSKAKAQVAIALLLIAFTTTIRPNGFIVLVATYTYLLVGSIVKKEHLVTGGILIFGLLAIAFGANLLGAIVERQEIVGSFIKGEIIWGYSPSYNPLPESSLRGLGANTTGLSAVFQLALSEPFYFLEVVFTKLFYLLSHTRPYWSSYHNVYAVLFLVPIYVMATASLFHRTAPLKIVSFASPLIAAQLLVVAFSFADWDGRHLLPIYPLFCLLAGFGFKQLFATFLPEASGEK